MRCDNCGNEYKNSLKCPLCGHRQGKISHCSVCGAAIHFGQPRCPNCGNPKLEQLHHWHWNVSRI